MVIGYTARGGGPEGVIVLHGWFGDSMVYEPIFPYLDTDTFTYAFMDYRGYGRSRDIPGKHTMAEISSDALALADHLGWKRFHVVGHSMGGMAVQRVALDAGGRVKSGVAITPVPASGAQEHSQHKAPSRTRGACGQGRACGRRARRARRGGPWARRPCPRRSHLQRPSAFPP